MTKRAVAMACPTTRNPLKSLILFGGAAMVAFAAMTVGARSQDVIVTHAVSNFGEPKYGPDMKHLDYVNPNAPKGGAEAAFRPPE